jgi:hypothetical protein
MLVLLMTINILFCGVNLFMIIPLLISEMVFSFVYMLTWNFLVVFFGCSLRFIFNVRNEGLFLWTFSTPVFSGHTLCHTVTYWSFVICFICISYCGNGLVPNFVREFPLLVCLFFNFYIMGELFSVVSIIFIHHHTRQIMVGLCALGKSSQLGY